MILFNKFGYALRHEMNFNPKTKRGSLALWSSYDGSGIGTDPVHNGKDSVTEFISHQFAFRGSLFGANYYAELPLGNENDILSLLRSLILAKQDKESSFSNYQDRLISFSINNEGKQSVKVINVKIRYTNNIGKLTLDEADELEKLILGVLTDMGYSRQEIGKLLKNKTTP